VIVRQVSITARATRRHRLAWAVASVVADGGCDCREQAQGGQRWTNNAEIIGMPPSHQFTRARRYVPSAWRTLGAAPVNLVALHVACRVSS
jgi:hypothetical protein